MWQNNHATLQGATIFYYNEQEVVHPTTKTKQRTNQLGFAIFCRPSNQGFFCPSFWDDLERDRSNRSLKRTAPQAKKASATLAHRPPKVFSFKRTSRVFQRKISAKGHFILYHPRLYKINIPRAEDAAVGLGAIEIPSFVNNTRTVDTMPTYTGSLDASNRTVPSQSRRKNRESSETKK
jgi:hypothetical protein